MTQVNKREIQDFIKSWSQGAHEVADKVTFWNAILKFLGVSQQEIDNRSFIDYEKTIKLKKNEHFDGSIDAYIPSTHVLIEQKSSGVDLTKKENRPNGKNTEKITPFEQARRYDSHLSAKEHAFFYVLCNFDEFIIYDIRESVDTKPIKIELKDLDKKLDSLDFLVNQHQAKLQEEKKVSVDAGKLVSKMYDELLNIFSNYSNLDEDKVKHSINELCVRLVFCLYAEDAKLFNTKEAFYNYLKDVKPNQIGLKLKELFKVLNTPEDDRNKTDQFWTAEHPDLAKFPYTNGGLFANEDIIIPPFTEKLKSIVLDEASRHFDWSAISPTVFGAVFESTLNPETRRSGGMHYTSVENIHKIIDPLFLNDLKSELKQIQAWKQPNRKKELAKEFQMKLSRLTFFDPACGSGNFLTETYLSLRKLENEALKIQYPNPLLDTGDSDKYIKVSIQQFFGIEINDFAVSVAKTALWIAESQMMEKTKDIFYANWKFLPLKTYTHIHEGNALKMNWNTVIENYGCHYIMGNPPFIGASMMTKTQKDEAVAIFGNRPRTRSIDYVGAWYYKAAEYIQGTTIKCAFVSTNSITEGEQVQPMWSELYNKYYIHINFAYRSFVWNSEAKSKAAVHCVIIGFSTHDNKNKLLFSNQIAKSVNQINSYLLDAPNVLIKNRSKTLNPKTLKITKGNQPSDGGHLLLTETEKKEVLKKYPQLKDVIKPYLTAKDYLNNEHSRYCLWFKNKDITKYINPFIKDRLKQVQEFRLKSSAKPTRQKADTPYIFFSTPQTEDNYLCIPEISSERRRYIPIGFLNNNTIASNRFLIIPKANLYYLGILDSSVHMAWIRVVAGRLEKRLIYSGSVVYNNFPWPTPTLEQRKKIEETAQGILDARTNHPNSSLATLYNPLTMPADLQKAHKANDKAVLSAYNLKANTSANNIVAYLFKLYEDLTK